MIILKLDYKYYAVSEKALEQIKYMCEVKQKRVGNKTKYYVLPEHEQPPKEISIVFPDDVVNIDDDRTICEDNAILLKEEKEKSERYSTYWLQEQKKVRELEARLAAYRCVDETATLAEGKVEVNKCSQE